jgi:phosphoserine aminotransferase
MTKRVFNFSAGPATLPESVLLKAQQEFLNYNNEGMSLIEMSHRSKTFEAVLAHAKAGVKRLLNVPDNYEILFLQGGASLQFSMTAMNLKQDGKKVLLINSGEWTKKALKEIKKETDVEVIASSEEQNFLELPSLKNIKIDQESTSFVYMCSNNTIFGTQATEFPDTGNVPLVCDMSSDIMSRPVDVSRFGLIFAGAQKNIGPAGITLVIIRKDLAERASHNLASMLQYRSFISTDSMYNTIPTFPVYILSMVMDWMQDQGGVSAIEKRNQEKAAILYKAINTGDFYYSPIQNQADRSLMNVVFRIKAGEDLEKIFVQEATAAGLDGLKGHRSVGGLRASIYNAHPVEGVQALVNFMSNFEKKYQKELIKTA